MRLVLLHLINSEANIELQNETLFKIKRNIFLLSKSTNLNNWHNNSSSFFLASLKICFHSCQLCASSYHHSTCRILESFFPRPASISSMPFVSPPPMQQILRKYLFVSPCVRADWANGTLRFPLFLCLHVLFLFLCYFLLALSCKSKNSL